MTSYGWRDPRSWCPQRITTSRPFGRLRRALPSILRETLTARLSALERGNGMTTEDGFPPPVKSLGTLAGKWEIGRGLYGDTNGRRIMPLLYLHRRDADDSRPVVKYEPMVEGSLDVEHFVHSVLDQVPEPTATALLQGATQAGEPDEKFDDAERRRYWILQVRSAVDSGRFIICSGLVLTRDSGE